MIKDRRGVWQFAAVVVGVCLAFTFAVTIVSDYFEGNSSLVIAIDLCISTFNVGILAQPLAYYCARSNLALYKTKCEASAAASPTRSPA